MFFKYEGKLLPFSYIKSYATDERNNTTIVLENGSTLKSNGFYTQDRIAAMAMPVVPAGSGYFKISLPESGDVMDANWPLVPIVAWRIVGELNFAEPITPEMDDEMPSLYAVLCPDGRVRGPGGGSSYECLADFFAEENLRNAPQQPPCDTALKGS